MHSAQTNAASPRTRAVSLSTRMEGFSVIAIGFKRFLRDESGPTATEYAVLLALILAVIIATITAVGNSTSSLWKSDANQINSAMGS
jgi:pilus assembly protein Flp/PilA